ncbi:MAG: HAD family hydrolase, partial [Desulfobacula sp.]|nr:HAD family hydrolase [Desulfobacula sp.]
KGLLIDLDGTLIDNLAEMFAVFQHFLSDYGQTGTRELFESFNGVPVPKVLEKLKKEYLIVNSVKDLIDQYTAMLHESQSSFSIREGSVEMLETAKSVDFRIALVTSSSRKRAEDILNGHNLLNHFDLIVGNEDVERGKPDPEPFLMAIQKLSLDATRTFSIEDSINGIQSASDSGTKTCYLTAKGHVLSKKEKKFTWKQIHNLRNMIDILNND